MHIVDLSPVYYYSVHPHNLACGSGKEFSHRDYVAIASNSSQRLLIAQPSTALYQIYLSINVDV